MSEFVETPDVITEFNACDTLNSTPFETNNSESVEMDTKSVSDNSQGEKAIEKSPETKANQHSYERCQLRLRLIKDLAAGNSTSLETDVAPIGKNNSTMETYHVIGTDKQGDLVLEHKGNKYTFSKKELVVDARKSAAELINNEFDNLEFEQQIKITNQAHEAGFIMANDLEALIDPEDTEKIEELKQLLDQPIVNTNTLGKALDVIGIPHSSSSINDDIIKLNESIDHYKTQLNKTSVSTDQAAIINTEIQKMQIKVDALKKVNTELKNKFTDDNWSVETAYQKMQEDGISGEEFYDQHFKQLFENSEIEKMIKQAELSEEKKHKLKEKLYKSVKVGGGIMGIFMLLILIQGMSSGQAG
jgi:hypothetical protein